MKKVCYVRRYKPVSKYRGIFCTIRIVHRKKAYIKIQAEYPNYIFQRK